MAEIILIEEDVWIKTQDNGDGTFQAVHVGKPQRVGIATEAITAPATFPTPVAPSHETAEDPEADAHTAPPATSA